MVRIARFAEIRPSLSAGLPTSRLLMHDAVYIDWARVTDYWSVVKMCLAK